MERKVRFCGENCEGIEYRCYLYLAVNCKFLEVSALVLAVGVPSLNMRLLTISQNDSICLHPCVNVLPFSFKSSRAKD